MKYSSQKDDLPSELPSPDQIAERAYALWENQGRHDGNHERHWFEAERLLREELAGELAEETTPEATTGELAGDARFQEDNPYLLPKARKGKRG